MIAVRLLLSRSLVLMIGVRLSLSRSPLFIYVPYTRYLMVRQEPLREIATVNRVFLFLSPGVVPMVSWYISCPGDNGHVLFKVCHIHDRGVIGVQRVVFGRYDTPTPAAGG